MINYIREHLKGFIGITLLVISTVAFIGTNELIAQLLPDAMDLTGVSFETDNEGIFEYTGNEIKPEFTKMVFEDKEGELVTVEGNDFLVKAYFNNVELGYGDIEVSLEGYRNSVVVEDVFQIVLGKVNNLKVVDSAKEYVDLTWKAVSGAEGYVVYKSVDNGATYVECNTINDGSVLTYKDTDITLNSTYFYQVAAYTNSDKEVVFGEVSEAVKHVTPLADPVAVAAEKADSASINVSWQVVEGAASYQVFRSNSETGEFALIGEVADPAVTTYKDTNCEIGIKYFYHVVACQKIDETIIYGTPSNVVSGSTIPNRVGLNGSTNEEKTSVTLSWKAVPGVDGYEVYAKSGSKYTLVKTITDGTLTYSESNLKDTSEYSYKVRAYKTVNGSKVFGEYSKVYTKEKKVVYNYSGSASGNTSGLGKYVGRPYKFGGTSPTSGWDCSAFVQYVYQNEFGVSIPRTSGQQAGGGQVISVSDRSSWKPGDILCYKNNGKWNHVAIYLGNGQMIHALNSKYDTFIQSVDNYESWDNNNLAGVRRY